MRIQDYNLFYTLLRLYSSCTIYRAYRKVECLGKENIPHDGAVIFAPNHTNALMDALIVAKVNAGKTVFVARADIFRKKRIAKLLTFCKIMPIIRMRDGRNNLKKNDIIMNNVVDVLCDQVPFCIMSEGTQRPKHSLLPLVKGIFRIALMTDERLANRIPLYIVPIGIEYGDYFRYRSSLLIQIGRPINVSEFVAEHADLDQPEIINRMRDTLSEAMKSLILYVPDNENYDAVLELCYLRNSAKQRQLGCKIRTLKGQLEANKETVANIADLQKTNPELAQKLIQLGQRSYTIRHGRHIADESIIDESSRKGVCKKAAFLTLTLPYFMLSAIMSAPITLPAAFICAKQTDKDFSNSFRHALALFLLPLICVTAVIASTLCHLPWYGILASVALVIPSHSFTHSYARKFRLFKSDLHYLKNAELQSIKTEVNTLMQGA